MLGAPCNPCCAPPRYGALTLHGFDGMLSTLNYATQVGFVSTPSAAFSDLFPVAVGLDDTLLTERLSIHSPYKPRPSISQTFDLMNGDIGFDYGYFAQARIADGDLYVRVFLRVGVRLYSSSNFAEYPKNDTEIIYRKSGGAAFLSTPQSGQRLTMSPAEIVSFSVTPPSGTWFARQYAASPTSVPAPGQSDAGSVTLWVSATKPSQFFGNLEVTSTASRPEPYNGVPLQFSVGVGSTTTDFDVSGTIVSITRSPSTVSQSQYYPSTYSDQAVVNFSLSRWAFAVLGNQSDLTMTFPEALITLSGGPGDPQSDLERWCNTAGYLKYQWKGGSYYSRLPVFTTANSQARVRAIA